MSINTNSDRTTFEDLQAQVLETFKRTDKTTELKRSINETYREMVGVIDPRKLKDQIYKPLIIGREEYAIPDTVLRINHPARLLDTTASNNSASSFPMDFISKDEYDRIEPNPNASTLNSRGRPRKYCFYKNSVLVTPIPDLSIYAIELNVGGEPTVLVEASDQTIFSPMWDEIIVAGSLARLFAKIEDWDNADKWQIIYRYGFAGKDSGIEGGLMLLKKLNKVIEEAPTIVKPRYF